ncbi:hypothetical protein BDN70DRAFT_885085 [Pholiota conissans]|uniref:GST N-terminal domain-containing protein n=1 Tax=Pholiota conissans TaxID=109636 RepID=A0A9P5YRL0_9AGAR|nr:hypothetical protein BDN70DRAFT_885085 [Pholiota conissans]
MQMRCAALRRAQKLFPILYSTAEKVLLRSLHSSASDRIVLYDIPSKLLEKAWSPNVWKIRYSLNYKGIPYETEWVEYPDIEGHCKKLGIAPTGHRAPFYTLPAIHDPSTDTYIADSLKIAEYLEKTYPSTPKLFPDNTLGLQTAFHAAFVQQMGSLWQFIYAPEFHKLNPQGADYFRRTREEKFGRTLEDLVPKGKQGEVEWAKFKAGLGRVDTWYAKSGGPFILGMSPSWADFIVASYAMWWRRIWGEESQEWKDVGSWHDGRWSKLLANLKEYQKVV